MGETICPVGWIPDQKKAEGKGDTRSEGSRCVGEDVEQCRRTLSGPPLHGLLCARSPPCPLHCERSHRAKCRMCLLPCLQFVLLVTSRRRWASCRAADGPAGQRATVEGRILQAAGAGWRRGQRAPRLIARLLHACACLQAFACTSACLPGVIGGWAPGAAAMHGHPGHRPGPSTSGERSGSET